MELSTRDKILTSARGVAQARGYAGLSFRELAADVGIKAASVYHYFPSKAELGAALARQYWHDAADALQSISAQSANPLEALSRYPDMFRAALLTNNHMCMCSFMAAEYEELPELVRTEVHAFANVNVAWLATNLEDASVVARGNGESRGSAIYAAVVGAQLIARSRADVSLYDVVIASYRETGLLPA
ncbi:transcriptional regulator [Mycolicibacterium wolinskyi]|uniref:Transcriptional regulator n=1 Tax=Mycolicibacterium wolinskyi TaxID=59750 RepID=A0A132PQ99_9MYCO|nr:transcriptional regulator [Mycolicibacterium wolinskyi]